MSIDTQIAGYRLEERIGKGGMGVVYRAHDLALERSVALKLLAPQLAEDPAFRERFLVESRLAASLDHPNVVPVYDAGEVEGQLYLAMRYVEGTDLMALLREEGKLEPGRTIAICEQVANALDAAHARGLVHRDVKPSNVLLDEREHAYLADFGLTRRLSEQAHGFDAGLSLGTPDYVAPEQIEGKDLDGRADQYSLACLLHECLTGKPPFARGSEAATLFAHLEEPPPAPPVLEDVMRRALAKSPEDRYGSCTELVADARHALGLEPKRVRWPLAVAGVGAALVGAALVVFFLTPNGTGSPAGPRQALAGRLVRLNASSGRTVSTTPVRAGSSDVVVDAGSAWMAYPRDGSMTRVDLETGETQRIQVAAAGVGPQVLAASATGVWLVNQGDSTVRFYDVRNRAFKLCVRPGTFPGGASYDTGRAVAYRGSLWVTAPNAERVFWYVDACSDPTQVARLARSHIGPYIANPTGIAVGEGAVWVLANGTRSSLIRFDRDTKHVVQSTRLPFDPSGVAAGANAVWVSEYSRDRLYRFDPRTLEITATAQVGHGPTDVVTANGVTWVLNSIDGTVSRMDPSAGRVVQTVSIGSNVHDLAAGEGSILVTRTELSG